MDSWCKASELSTNRDLCGLARPVKSQKSILNSKKNQVIYSEVLKIMLIFILSSCEFSTSNKNQATNSFKSQAIRTEKQCREFSFLFIESLQ